MARLIANETDFIRPWAASWASFLKARCYTKREHSQGLPPGWGGWHAARPHASISDTAGRMCQMHEHVQPGLLSWRCLMLATKLEKQSSRHLDNSWEQRWIDGQTQDVLQIQSQGSRDSETKCSQTLPPKTNATLRSQA